MSTRLRCILAAVGGLTLSSPAFAYIDPGASMLLLQGLLALLGAIVVFIKNPIKVLRSAIRRLLNKKNA